MVILLHSTNELIKEREQEKSPVGFVPTMGNLHEGHLSLLKKALSLYKTVYFSIFVNPKQFGPNEDFNRYPRTLDEDLRKIKEVARAFPDAKIVIFAPLSPDEVYPPGYDQKVIVPGISETLEGALRPGHFDGVSTVVYRLFEITRPEEAFFGLKDYQQYLVIKKMTEDLLLPIKITGMPIIRDNDGLALSSRNQYLSPEERSVALTLSKTLNRIKAVLENKRSHLPRVETLIKEILQDQRWNYLELRDAQTLSSDVTKSDFITILAVYQLGTTRLLDNMQLELV